jgi:hypothetical protein
MSYTFDNLARNGNDNCYMDQKNIQNLSYSNYLLNNYFQSDCLMNKVINVATTQPGVNYKGGYQTGEGGCNIDQNTYLKMDTILSHPKCKITLEQRPFITVPYLGRGYVDSNIESKLIQGEYNYNRKTSNPIMEQSYIPYSHTPLLSNIQGMMNNPKYMIEHDASQDWIRGGVPSRELTRDVNQVI